MMKTDNSPERPFASLSIHDSANSSNSGPPAPPAVDQVANDDELERFRQEWKQEVQSKRSEPKTKVQSPTASPKIAVSSLPHTSPARRIAPPLYTDDETASTASTASAPAVTSSSNVGSSGKIPFRAPTIRKDRDSAVQLYARAVEKEQTGQLNDALMLYRKAFKMDDRLYARAVAKPPDRVEKATATLTSTDIVSVSVPQDEPYSFQRHIQVHPDYERSAAQTHISNSTVLSGSQKIASSPLTALFHSLPVAPFELSFLPDDEALPIPIARLPAELMDPILGHLDIASVERFALTCWRARHLTSISNVWKAAVEGIYRPPAMIPDGWHANDLVHRHAGEWRTTFIDEERVRLDGCYISICHYIRPGAGDQWVTITHMITYHRFLRFYPDGFVMSFLTTEHPSDIVPTLRPSLRAKGLHFGRWRLVRSDAASDENPNPEAIKDLKDKVKGRRATIFITDLLEPGLDSPKYEFEMELTLRETGRGRWNKLDLRTYRSINLATGEALELSLKHQKPFYFSKVRSYHPPL